MVKYKILKKNGTYSDCEFFYAYRKNWFLGRWKRIGILQDTLEKAEELIAQDKRERQKPVLVGYYS